MLSCMGFSVLREIGGNMKKIYVSILLAMILLVSACGQSNEEYTVSEGSYSMKISEETDFLAPSVYISEGWFTFSYDLLSSYLSTGYYEISGDKLILKTDDNLYEFVFRIEDGSLFFQEDESSSVKLIDERFGIPIQDQAEFILGE